jgi:Ni/Co efflux regulator RcnB
MPRLHRLLIASTLVVCFAAPAVAQANRSEGRQPQGASQQDKQRLRDRDSQQDRDKQRLRDHQRSGGQGRDCTGDQRRQRDRDGRGRRR